MTAPQIIVAVALLGQAAFNGYLWARNTEFRPKGTPRIRAAAGAIGTVVTTVVLAWGGFW